MTINCEDDYEKWLLPNEERELVHIPSSSSYISEISDMSSYMNVTGHVDICSSIYEEIEDEIQNEEDIIGCTNVKVANGKMKRQWGDEVDDDEKEEMQCNIKDKSEFIETHEVTNLFYSFLYNYLLFNLE